MSLPILHTAGPWTWVKAGECYALEAAHQHRGVLDADGGKLRLTERGGGMVPFDPKHPDAQLMAAAPLLAEQVGRASLQLLSLRVGRLSAEECSLCRVVGLQGQDLLWSYRVRQWYDLTITQLGEGSQEEER